MDINEEFSALQSSYLKARAESDRCMNELYFFLKHTDTYNKNYFCLYMLIYLHNYS